MTWTNPRNRSNIPDLEAEVLSEGPLLTGASAHEFLSAVWNDPGVPLPLRIRAAVEALPYERPKLAATTIFHLGRDLDEAIARSERLSLLSTKA